ncbi:MAG: hypothetical protein HY360_03650 [Verrucomicrobia bacterium]|nr:hypothetical protein [Verrucomicrobiota bacterium]
MPWNDIPSQPLVRDLLARSLRHGRVHHAYLFVGEESETDPLALAFAQALNCDRNDGDFCGTCASCRDIAAGRHPDVFTVRAESKSRRIRIAQMRELERVVHLKASRARTKVGVIHTADRLQSEAQDAFLKTLEEPPPHTVLLLVTEEPQQLKETILSRCLRVPFRPGARKEKTGEERRVESWLEAFAAPVAPSESVFFRAYALAGNLQAALKQAREEKLQEAHQLLQDPVYEHLEPDQRENLKEEMDAQAQAEYLRQRSRILKFLLEWHHARQGGGRSVEILEKLARRLARNVNEPLSLEIAMIGLATHAAAGVAPAAGKS